MNVSVMSNDEPPGNFSKRKLTAMSFMSCASAILFIDMIIVDGGVIIECSSGVECDADAIVG